MSIHDSKQLGDVKVVMLKGEKGEKGDGSYDDAEIRGLLANESRDRASADASLSSSKADKTEVNELATNKADKTEVNALAERVSTSENDIHVLDARMDTFASLPSGSTSGNAELVDIRIGADGTTYSSAGDAVRGQVSDLKSEINDLEIVYQKKTFTLESGWQSFRYPMLAGRTYEIASALTGGSLFTSKNGTTNVETISTVGIAGALVEFTPTQNTEYIRSWYGASNTITISLKGTILSQVGGSLFKPISQLDVSLFEKGFIDSSGGDSAYKSGNRARTSRLYALNDIRVTALTDQYSNARLAVHSFSNGGGYIGETGWLTNATIKEGSIFRLEIASDINTETGISVSDVLSCFEFKSANTTNLSQVLLLDNVSMLFEHGGLYNGANDTWHENARIRTTSIVKSKKDIYIHWNSGAYSIHMFDSNNVFTHNTDWLTNDHIIPAGLPFRLLVTQNIDSTAFEDIDTILQCINIEEITTHSTGISPNIIYQCRNVDDTAYPLYSKWYIQASAKNQYDRVRFNVWKTTDGHYFLCHGATINNEARNMDGTVISTSIPTEGRTLAELNSYDWGIQYGEQYAGSQVPLLEDALFYSALYNMGVTIEFSQSQQTWNWSDTDTQNVIDMCDKYGITDNLIVIDASGSNLEFLRKFVNHDERTSVYVGGAESLFTANMIENINSLKTEHNKIYVQLLPWGTAPTNTFIKLAKANGWILYDSITMSKSDLLNADTFSKGYGLIEVNNVYMVKNTVRNWADMLVNE